MRILDPAADRGTIALTYTRALQLLPALKAARSRAAWAGYIDSTPDGVPGIGELRPFPGSSWQPDSAAMASASDPAPAI